MANAGSDEIKNAREFLTLFNKENDSTAKIGAPNRRMDALAYLFQLNSCAAVGLVGNNIYIAINDSTSTKPTSEGIKAIIDTMLHFKEIVETENINKINSNQAFTQLVHSSLFKSQEDSNPSITKDLRNQLAKFICNNKITKKSQNEFEIEFKRKFPGLMKHKNSQGIIANAFYQAVALRVAFLKVERAIFNKTHNKITQQQLDAIKNFTAAQHILHYNKPAIKQGKIVHAEVRLLEKMLLNKIAQKESREEFYIGISKRCCQDCNMILRAANKELQAENLGAVSHRGDHNLSFVKKWKIPTALTSSNNPIIKKILVRYHEIKKNFKKQAENLGSKAYQKSIDDALKKYNEDLNNKKIELKGIFEKLSKKLSNNITLKNRKEKLEGQIKDLEEKIKFLNERKNNPYKTESDIPSKKENHNTTTLLKNSLAARIAAIKKYTTVSGVKQSHVDSDSDVEYSDSDTEVHSGRGSDVKMCVEQDSGSTSSTPTTLNLARLQLKRKNPGGEDTEHATNKHHKPTRTSRPKNL